MKAFISMALRTWVKKRKGGYNKFLQYHENKPWISEVTEEMYKYILTNPPIIKKNGDKENKQPYNRTAPYTPPAKMYLPIWEIEKTEIGKEGVAALKMFIEALKLRKKGKFELVEYANPNIIEIREKC